MKTIKEWQDEVGYTAHQHVIPSPQFKIVAYVSGKVVECKSEAEAKATSKMWESITINQDVIENWKTQSEQMRVVAKKKWIDEHKQWAQDTYGFSKGVVDIMFSRVYDQHIDYGYVRVESAFEDECEYMSEIFKG